MKVMHILDSLNRGGAEMLALDVCRNASENKLDLTFVATGTGDLENDFRNSGVEFIPLQRTLPVDLSLAVRLHRIIEERGIELVHVHQAVEGLHAYLASRGSNVKRVMTFHLSTADTKNRVALRFLVPRMHANIAVSNDLLQSLAEVGIDTSERFHVIHNGVDPSRLDNGGTDLRAELGLGRDELLVGMIGNFYPDGRKDQLTLCQALPKVLRNVPHANLVFAGGIVDRANVEMEKCVEFCQRENVSDRVHFLGKRTNITDVLAALDIYVQSSRNEALPIAVIEALLKRLPVIVSDIGPLIEATDQGRCASVFRTGAAEQLGQEIIDLALDESLRINLGDRGGEWAREQFGIDAHIQKLRTLYQSLLS
jgi:glycosyltransferase involved in cell wall biosynthesis